MEIAMGGPSIGTLYLSNGFMLESCSPSMVWSHDSVYLAVPVWTHERMQKLAVISVENRRVVYVGGIYRVLQLESFNNGVIRGIDSPIHRPEKVEIDVRKPNNGEKNSGCFPLFLSVSIAISASVPMLFLT